MCKVFARLRHCGPIYCSVDFKAFYGRFERWNQSRLRPHASFFFGVRIMLGTILGRFSIIYFRGLGLRIKVMVWVMARARVRVWVRVGVGVGVRVSVMLWSW